MFFDPVQTRKRSRFKSNLSEILNFRNEENDETPYCFSRFRINCGNRSPFIQNPPHTCKLGDKFISISFEMGSTYKKPKKNLVIDCNWYVKVEKSGESFPMSGLWCSFYSDRCWKVNFNSLIINFKFFFYFSQTITVLESIL